MEKKKQKKQKKFKNEGRSRHLDSPPPPLSFY